jgi:hypothetical protein
MPFKIADMSLSARVAQVTHTSKAKSKIPWFTVEIQSPVTGYWFVAGRWQFAIGPQGNANSGTLTIVPLDPPDANDEDELAKAVGSQLQVRVRYQSMCMEYLSLNLLP